MPEEPETEKVENPLEQPKRWIGKPPPKPKTKGKKQKAARKQNKQKGKEEFAKPNWAGKREDPPKTSHHYHKEFKKEIFGQKNISSFKRGAIDIEVDPCLIKELLLPDNPPPDVLIYLEAAHYAHNSSNYYLALKNYELA